MYAVEHFDYTSRYAAARLDQLMNEIVEHDDLFWTTDVRLTSPDEVTYYAIRAN